MVDGERSHVPERLTELIENQAVDGLSLDQFADSTRCLGNMEVRNLSRDFGDLLASLEWRECFLTADRK